MLYWSSSETEMTGWIAAADLVSVSPVLVWVPVGVIVLVAVLASIMALRAPRRQPTSDRFWRGRVFYVNPDDPALFVPKRFGIGYTINFAHPWSSAALAVIVLVAAVPIMVAALVLQHVLLVRH